MPCAWHLNLKNDLKLTLMMLQYIPDALSQFDGLNLQVIVLGCTSASFAANRPNINIPERYQYVKFISTFDAIIAQIKKTAAQNIMLFAPYDQYTINAEVELLNSYGINVAKSVSLNYVDEIRYIGEEQTYRYFLKMRSVECDAVLFSCTALYTLKVIRWIKAELDTNIPLLSSNTSIANTLNDLYQNYSRQGNY